VISKRRTKKDINSRVQKSKSELQGEKDNSLDEKKGGGHFKKRKRQSCWKKDREKWHRCSGKGFGAFGGSPLDRTRTKRRTCRDGERGRGRTNPTYMETVGKSAEKTGDVPTSVLIGKREGRSCTTIRPEGYFSLSVGKGWWGGNRNRAHDHSRAVCEGRHPLQQREKNFIVSLKTKLPGAPRNVGFDGKICMVYLSKETEKNRLGEATGA